MEHTGRTSCPLCGAHRTPADARGPHWSSQHAGDRVSWVCAACTRDHLFEIECGLPLRRTALPMSA